MIRLPEHRQNRLSFQKSAQPLRLLKNMTEPANSNEIWLITLSDLLMLLMIFFVFLLAAPIVSAGKPAPPVAKAAEQPKAAAAKTAIDGAVTNAPDLQDKQAVSTLEDDLHNMLGNREDRQGVTVERRSQFIVITFPEQILFDSGQAQMKTAVGPTLGKVAVFIINHPDLSVEVQGHTDDRPIRSQRYPSNWELSADRAIQIAKTLVELGANPQQIAAKGFGEYHPIVPNISDTDRLKNRRVEIQFSLPHAS
jgi:chemotaxis protein MotB